MDSVYDRTEMLIGPIGLSALRAAKVVVFGLGGVGGHVVEALARAGVGELGVVDCDTVDVTNINRQIIALRSSVGKFKADLFAERIHDINDRIKVNASREKVTAVNAGEFFKDRYDYAVDAVDDVAAKVALIEAAKALNVPVISSMGTGNKMDPARFMIADISGTHTCPLAKRVRKEISSRGISDVKVLFSDEPASRCGSGSGRPASISYVPAAAGMLIAGEVIRDLISFRGASGSLMDGGADCAEELCAGGEQEGNPQSFLREHNTR